MSTLSARPPRFVGRPLVPAVPLSRAPAAGHSLGFACFLLLTFVLFLRPTWLISPSGVYGSAPYQTIILVCFALSYPVVLGQLRAARLESRPISFCLFLFTLSIPLSLLARFSFVPAADLTVDFLKSMLYF